VEQVDLGCCLCQLDLEASRVRERPGVENSALDEGSELARCVDDSGEFYAVFARALAKALG
jgi:hypothetical protein